MWYDIKDMIYSGWYNVWWDKWYMICNMIVKITYDII